ncbi:MAG: hypothetical protein WDM81_09850 [Rhizomicrobium sp.]
MSARSCSSGPAPCRSCSPPRTCASSSRVDGEADRIDATIDLIHAAPATDMIDALDSLLNGGDRTLHVIAPTNIKGEDSIGIILSEGPIRAQLIAYADRVIVTGLIVSLFTAFLVFASLYLVFVRPMRRVTEAMVAFRGNPEDPAASSSPAPGGTRSASPSANSPPCSATSTDFFSRRPASPRSARRWRASSTICATSSPTPSLPPTG